MKTCSQRAFSKSVSLAGLAVLASFSITACGKDDPVSTPVVPGFYAATSFTATTSGATTNVLGAGGSFAIRLTAEGTTTGTLFIPGTVSGEGDVYYSLEGTWSQTGGTVNFEHNADTFVRDMPFRVSGSTLVGDRTFDATRVVVTLSIVD